MTLLIRLALDRSPPRGRAAERIATAMGEKDWSDFLGGPFRKLGLTAKPLMLRLVPEPPASAP